MRRVLLCLAIGGFLWGQAFSQSAEPFTPDSSTVALWHLDENSGSVVHDSTLRNNGTAIGTTIVPGRFGNARWFNGIGDYVLVPSDSSLNLGDSSFVIEVWFNTVADSGYIIRRGMAPTPGYNILVNAGRLGCQMGNSAGGHWPDTVLSIISTKKFNDGQWHLAKMVRDRRAKTLSLYADSVLVAPPIGDSLAFPLVNDRPLTIGRWEYDGFPEFFTGTIDEIRISSSNVRHAAPFFIEANQVDFGKVLLGTRDTVRLTIVNRGMNDSLRVVPLASTNSVFSASFSEAAIPPLDSASLLVFYAPITAKSDSGTITISTSDPQSPLVGIRVIGQGVSNGLAPVINSISFVSNDSAHARITWYRAVNDTEVAIDPVVQYSIWRLVQSPNASMQQSRSFQLKSSLADSLLWDFISSVPALHFDRYAVLVPLIPNSGTSTSWNVFLVAAETKNMQVYLSIPDSIPSPRPANATTGLRTTTKPDQFALEQNFPNPFNPNTTIRYSLAHYAFVNLVVYNTLGQEVARLVSAPQSAGIHEVTLDGSGLASGVYIYRLQAGSFTASKSLILIK